MLTEIRILFFLGLVVVAVFQITMYIKTKKLSMLLEGRKSQGLLTAGLQAHRVSSS